MHLIGGEDLYFPIGNAGRGHAAGDVLLYQPPVDRPSQRAMQYPVNVADGARRQATRSTAAFTLQCRVQFV